MRNNIITRIISGAKNSKKRYSEQDIKNMQNSINMVARCYKSLLAEKANMTEEQLREIIINGLISINNEYTRKANNKGLFFQLEGIDYLLNNSKVLEKTYEKVKENRNSNNPVDLIYNSDLKRSCENLMKLAISELEGMEEDINPEVKNFFNEYEKADKAGKMKLQKRYNKKDVDKMIKAMPMYVGSYPSRINEYLKELRKLVERDIRTQQYDVMSYMHNLLEQFGLLDKYLNIQNKQMKRETGLDLTYPYSGTDSEKIGAEDVFTEDFLSKQSLEDVLTYSAFWQNRYSKIWKEIGQGIYAIDTLGMWKNIAKGQERIDLNENEIRALLNKENCLKELGLHIISGMTQDSRNIKEKNKVDDNCIAVSMGNTIEKYEKQEGKNYKDTFDELISLSENDFKRDTEMYSTITAQIMNTYKMKNAIMVYKIRSLFESKKTKNWGIILNEIKNGKLNNSLDSNSKNLLIGIDYEGFNMPLRLHIPRKLLTNLLNQYKGDAIIPMYEGADDFRSNGEILTTNILMPITKEQGRLISKAVHKDNGEAKNINLLEHLLFLKDKDKYPKHLKKGIITKKGVVYERPPKKYVDLMSGDEYHLNGKEFVKSGEKIKDEVSR